MDGDGLLGEQFINIMPNQSATYELIYMPLKVGKSKGTICI